MDKNKYQTPTECEKDGMVAEPVATYSHSPHHLDDLRHQVMDAVASSEDKVTLIWCLSMLKGERRYRRKTTALSDEQLAQRLASEPDWDQQEHADLSQIDYGKYKPYNSPQTRKTIEKWL